MSSNGDKEESHWTSEEREEEAPWNESWRERKLLREREKTNYRKDNIRNVGVPSVRNQIRNSTRGTNGVQGFPSSQFMRLHSFDPLIPCADGSPSGIYIEENPKVPNSKNHVLVFIGGAACTDPQDCETAYQMEPFKFSTNFYPSTLEGTTILSRDPSMNPTMHNYTKWLVPYCSQDFFLGDTKKGKVGNFTHGGSLIFDTALKYWQDQVYSENAAPGSVESKTDLTLDNVVVVGMSAASIGVVNKVEKIRATVNPEDEMMQTHHLKIMLDSPSVLNDQQFAGKNLKTAMLTYTDLEENPLCHPLHPFSRAFERMSALPCCLSIHCILRYDDRMSSFYDNSSDNAEELLILDSAYDALALIGPFDLSSGQNTHDSISSDDFFAQFEFGGSRKARGAETAAFAKLQSHPKIVQDDYQARVKWIFGSCFQHSYLVPSPAILQMSCLYGNYEDVSYGYDCRDNGHSLMIDIDDFSIGVTRTTDTWDIAFFRDESMHEIINNFIVGSSSDELSSPIILEGNNTSLTNGAPDVIDFRLESCSGPNCRDNSTAPASSLPSCQSMIETTNYFASPPTGLVILWSVALLLILIMALVLRLSWTKTSIEALLRLGSRKVFGIEEDKVESSGDMTLDIEGRLSKNHHSDTPLTIDGINVITSDGKHIVTNVNISLTFGTINALCGRSGSGKTSILRALSLLHRPGVEVKIEGRTLDLELTPKAYLRQHDDCESFSKLIPADYLRYTARILHCDEETTEDVMLFASRLFLSKETKQNSENRFDPFTSTKIENLSGGQQRFLNIAVALLSRPKLLLLDEPLSGLDYASSLFVLKGLQAIAQRDKCAIFMTVHQPSKKVLKYYDKVFLIESGRLIFEKSVKVEGASAIRKSLEGSLVFGGSLNESSVETFDITPNSKTTKSDTDISYGNRRDIDTRGRGMKMISKTLKQIAPLARRLHPQFGWEPFSGVVLIIALVIPSCLLSRCFFVKKVTLQFLCLIGIPSVIFPHKVTEHGAMYKAHRQELEDQNITPMAFQISTALYTFPVPIISLLLGTLFSYLILQEWPFQSFAYQYVISCVHLLCSLQFGRLLMVLFQGEFSKVFRAYVVFLVISFIFNGVWVTTKEVPEYLSWAFYFSINFWGISGSVMRQFQSDVYSNAEYCNDLVSCLATDGNFMVRNLGFAQVSNTKLSLRVLTGVFTVFFLSEYIVLRYADKQKEKYTCRSSLVYLTSIFDPMVWLQWCPRRIDMTALRL
jgi:ABC-type multidrug transport system ATPase subunit